MLELLILLILFSLDTLLVCITYSINKIHVPFKSYFLIVLLCSISLFCGKIFAFSINNNLSTIINFIPIFSLGVYNIFQNKIKKNFVNKNNKLLKIYLDEVNADLDNSKYLSSKEAILLSIVLSIDSLIGGISINLMNYNIYFVMLIFSIINFVFIGLGNLLGKRFNNNSVDLSYICGVILILISIFKII